MQYRNLSLLGKDEEKTREKSVEDFDTELGFIEANSELFLETFKILSKDCYKRFTYSEDATYRISYRIFRIVRCAISSSLEGYYDVTTALLRIAYENHLLMHYLSENEDEAKLWFEGKRFAPNFVRKKVSYSSDSLYQEMSECIHSSFKSTSLFYHNRERQNKSRGWGIRQGKMRTSDTTCSHDVGNDCDLAIIEVSSRAYAE
ncbi:hypothetical protein MUP01_00010 [Candidatus Bathyarchaeota archaeon]|nr:hypothetical protein [Candidatus Bathyarchaeota archaeon]